jgi:4-amino-4-deoxy-L-arabinose transferase-like glycosyltransferase
MRIFILHAEQIDALFIRKTAFRGKTGKLALAELAIYRKLPAYMRQLLQHQFWIVAAAGVVFFTNLGATRLWDLDEPLYASCAREMLDQGDWVVPRYNGDIFYDKPPLMFWLMMGGFEMFGVNEFGARFWSAVLGVATALVAYHIGRLLFRAEVGFWAGLCTATTLIYTVSARAATVDCALTFVTSLAMLAFVIGYRRLFSTSSYYATADDSDRLATDGTSALGINERSCRPLLNLIQSYRPLLNSVQSRRPTLSLNWLLYVLIYACLGVAVLAKGPVGFLLPAATIGLFLLIVNQPPAAAKQPPSTRAAKWMQRLAAVVRPFAPRNFLKSFWQMRPLTGMVVVCAIALPWFVLVDLRTDGAWLSQFFGKYNLGPFIKPFMGHRGPFFYHFIAVMIGFFPWAVFMTPTVLHSIDRIRRRGAGREGHIFLWCWVGVFFVFWSLCSTKLPHYVLPAYPAIALLTGCFLQDWLDEPARVHRRWARNAGLGLVIVGVGIAAVVPIATAIFAPGEGPIGLVGLVLVLGGGVFLWLNNRGRQRQALAVFAATAVVFITGMFGFAAIGVDRHQNSQSLVSEIQRAGPEPQLAGYRFLQASMVFYAGRSVPDCDNIDQLRRFLAESPRPFIVTTDEYAQDIERAFPGELSVFARQPRFLRRDEEILVFARNDGIAPPRVAGKITAEPRQ